MKKVGIGIVGCGAISGIYMENITKMFKEIEIIGICDIVAEKAKAKSEEFGGLHIYKDMTELFKDPAVEIVLNLTRPYEHFDVTSAAIAAGKHVYSEKPLGATFEEGKKLMELAKAANVLIGGAPDTFMGAGIQTCRKLIDDGVIGDVVGAAAFMVCRGHETWHPDPAFYYQFGGGPMLDMGPYYVTALISMLGAVDTVSGMTKASFPTRLITSEPKSGEVVKVETSTYITGLMNFASGAIGTIFTTFDAYVAEVPRIEIYGSKGTLSVPDPNYFGGPIRLYRPEAGQFHEVPLMFDYPENSRGLGVADMAKYLSTGKGFRAKSELTYHVLEVLTSFEKSSAAGAHIKLETTCERPVPMIPGGLMGVIN